MGLFNRTKELLKEINYDCYMEIEDCDWSFFEDGEYEVVWSSNGYIYSGDLTKSFTEQDDCVFVNVIVDNGCGETLTKVFNKKNNYSWEDFQEHYEV